MESGLIFVLLWMIMLNKIPDTNRIDSVFFRFTMIKLCLNVIIILRLITISNLWFNGKSFVDIINALIYLQ